MKVPVVWTLHELGQPEPPHEGLLLGDDAPGHRGRRRLHDGLAEEVAGQRGEQVQAHAARPGTLAHQRDVVRVALDQSELSIEVT